MRIWSLHPKYLDSRGLVALWRETLLAKNVFAGKTKGYKNHPQLNRFKLSKHPLDLINHYLVEILHEASKRGYHFNKKKINTGFIRGSLKVTTGQMEYEKQHLLKKLERRDEYRFRQFKKIKEWEPHPLFTIIPGKIEDWEIT